MEPLVDASRDDGLRGSVLGLMASVDLLHGEVERCRARTEKMIAIADRGGYAQARGWARNLQVSLALHAGAVDDARDLAEEARAILTTRGEPDSVSAVGLHAVSLLRLGRVDEAIAEASELESVLWEQPQMSPVALKAYSAPAEVWVGALARSSGGEPSAGALKSALRLLGRYAAWFPVARPRWLRLRGDAARVTGRTAAARKLLGKAAEEARRRGLPHERVQALESLASLSDPAEQARIEAQVAPLRARMGRGWLAREGSV